MMDIISGSKYHFISTVLVTSRLSESAQLQTLLEIGIGRHIEVVVFSEKEILGFAYNILTDSFTNF